MGEIPASEGFGKIDTRLVLDGAMCYQYSSKVRIFANIRAIGIHGLQATPWATPWSSSHGDGRFRV